MPSGERGGNAVLKRLRKRPVTIWFKTKYPTLWAFLKSSLTIFIFYLLCVIYYVFVENWTIIDCIYFITVTITTVGYGDFSPSNNDTRGFTIIVIIFGLTFIFTIMNDFATSLLNSAQARAQAIAKNKVVTGLEQSNSKFALAMRYMQPVCLIAVIILVGSVFFCVNEKWPFMEALYFSFVTTTTGN